MFGMGGFGGIKNLNFGWKFGEEWIYYIGLCEFLVIFSI